MNTRMIIDDEIHPDSEFENQYTETTVTASDFPARKGNLYTQAPEVDISSAENEIVYKLYNDAGELLQTENVPVVKDGTSLGGVKEYYIRTTTNTAPDRSASGWSENFIPVFTGENKYLWNYEKIIDTKGNELSSTSPVLLDTTGKQIESITEQYAVTTTTETPSESDWQTGTIPTLTATNKYLWNREKIKYIGITAEETTLEAIIGVYGDKGEQGEQGEQGIQGVQGEKGDKGDTGAQGKQGGQYLGYSNSPLSVNGKNAGDFYLEDMYIIFSGTQRKIKYLITPSEGGMSYWASDTLPDNPNNMSWRWKAAIEDVIYHATGEDTDPFTLAANAWCEKLCANTILANKIKAKSGFFDSITVTGDSNFEGNVKNGVLSVKKPTLTEYTYTGELIECPKFGVYHISEGINPGETWRYGQLKVLDPSTLNYPEPCVISTLSDFTPYIINGLFVYPSDYSGTFTGLEPGETFSTVLLNDLPSESSLSSLTLNQLYVDSEGYIRIKNS